MAPRLDQISTGISLTGDKELDLFFGTVTGKLQRGGIRKGVRAGGSVLVKEIRSNIATMVSEEAASRGGRVRLDSRDKKTSLKKSIGIKTWSRPKQGIIGVVVGGRWPEGAHAHLVEFGHYVVSHGQPTGVFTRPVPFQRKAQRTARNKIVAVKREKLKQAIRQLKKPIRELPKETRV